MNMTYTAKNLCVPKDFTEKNRKGYYMKIIKVDLGKDLKELHIIPISDVHIGDKLTNYKLLKETLETEDLIKNIKDFIKE